METDLVKTLTSYVPALVVRRIAVNPQPIAEPTAERFGAAVLFADIRGFTAIADRLAQQGQVGAEHLAELLNACFGRLIDVVHEHGGEVTKFAGDALLALWPVPQDVMRLGREAQEALAKMVVRSAQCGLAIQDSLDVFETSDGTRLRLQVGIGAGDVYSVHLGGVLNRWEFLLSGAPLAQMSQAKEAAQPGQVVISPEAWSFIRSECGGKTLPGGFVELRSTPNVLPVKSLELPPLSVTAKPSLQSYIPAAVLSRLEQGHDQWLSEMRRVVVLFIKLPQYGTSIKHPYDRTIPEAQAVMEALQGALYRYAGSINKLNVDDKGITLVAALGLPPLSHRNDAARGVHAALEMQSTLANLGRRSAIGITMGWVFCGPVGNYQRREYTMVGNAVNMAARLMQAAEEALMASRQLADTFCDEAVYRAVRELTQEGDALAQRLSFRTLPAIGMKGMSEPVMVYRPGLRSMPVHRAQAENRRSTTLVGKVEPRQIVEAQISSLWRKSKEKRYGLIIIESESGNGKSLFVSEIREMAAKMGVRVLEGVADGLEQATPYFAWRSVFRQLFEVDPFLTDRNERRSHVLRQLPPIRGERGFPAFAIRMAPLLNVVLPLELPENHTTSKMSRELRHRTRQQFLLRLLQRQVVGGGRRKSQPTLLILENGQWMDPTSWELAIEVSREVKPLLTIIATRPICEQAAGRALSGICQQVEGDDHILRLELKPLGKPEVADLLRHELGIKVIPGEVLEILHQRAGGRPAFALASIRQWREMGLVDIDGGVARLTASVLALSQARAPESVQQAIIARIERLSPTQQLILKTASVVGESFGTQALMAIYPIKREADSIPGELRSLAQGELLLPWLNGEEPGYRFASAYHWQAANSLMPLEQRRRLREALLGK